MLGFAAVAGGADGRRGIGSFSVLSVSSCGIAAAVADHQESATVRRFERALAEVQPLLARYGYGAAVGLIGGALIGDQMQARQQQEDDLQSRMAAQDAEIQRQNIELQRLKAQQAR